MNMVATFVSGWVVIGLPDLGAALGPASFAFLMICTFIGSFMNIVLPPLGRFCKERNYLGPNDFASDRFNSRIVTIFSSLGGMFSSYVVLVIEWIMLKTVASWLFRDQIEDGNLSPEMVVWGLGLFIYACETIGGMESVALTDAVQCSFLVISFISIYFLIEFKYSGYTGIFGDDHSTDNTRDRCQNYQTTKSTWPEEHPAYGLTTLVEPRNHWSNGTHIVFTSADMSHLLFQAAPSYEYGVELSSELQQVAASAFEDLDSDFLPYNLTEFGCVQHTAPWWMDYPPVMFSSFMFWFPFGALVFGITPAVIHRVMVSSSDDQFRMALAPVHYFPWFFAHLNYPKL